MAKIPQFNRIKFTDVWDNADSFYTDYNESGLKGAIDEEHTKLLYYLLVGKYANNIIANYDVNQFKYKVYSIIFSYGAEWQRKLAIQKTFRDMSEADLIRESKTIMNHANNPSTPPSTGETEELNYVDDQNVSTRNKAKIEAYQFLWSVLQSNITPEFVGKFESCFTKFLAPYIEVVYCSKDDEN